MIDVRSAAAALRGDVIGRDAILCPGPGHSSGDRSLKVWLTPSGVTVHPFSPKDDWRECRDYVKAALGLRDDEGPAKSMRVRYVAESPPAPPSDLALRIWRETKPIAGTLAEKYLLGRKLPLPDRDDALRFHPSCPFGTERLPCMVALYRDISTNEPKAIHRTALTPEGQKIDRKALGPKGGCAIKLTPHEDVTYGLAIAEGIETALAGMALNFNPAWALGDAGSISTFPVLSGIECLTILVDHDRAGETAAHECSSRWTAAGCEVFTVEPITGGTDMADVWFERAA